MELPVSGASDLLPINAGELQAMSDEDVSSLLSRLYLGLADLDARAALVGRRIGDLKHTQDILGNAVSNKKSEIQTVINEIVERLVEETPLTKEKPQQNG